MTNRAILVLVFCMAPELAGAEEIQFNGYRIGSSGIVAPDGSTLSAVSGKINATRLGFVQTGGRITSEWKAGLAEKGIERIGYASSRAYLVKLPERISRVRYLSWAPSFRCYRR